MKCKIKTDQTGKPDAGNPHARFEEGEVAPTATPRRGSLLYNTRAMLLSTAAALGAAFGAAGEGWRQTDCIDGRSDRESPVYGVNEEMTSKTACLDMTTNKII